MTVYKVLKPVFVILLMECVTTERAVDPNVSHTGHKMICFLNTDVFRNSTGIKTWAIPFFAFYSLVLSDIPSFFVFPLRFFPVILLLFTPSLFAFCSFHCDPVCSTVPIHVTTVPTIQHRLYVLCISDVSHLYFGVPRGTSRLCSRKWLVWDSLLSIDTTFRARFSSLTLRLEYMIWYIC